MYPDPVAPLIVAGLGNPGPAYEGTLHNVGRDWVRNLGTRLGAAFSLSRRFGGELAKASMAGHSLSLYLPGTWMNESGVPLQRLLSRSGCPADRLLVAHDEMDLPAGTVRLKFGGGDAGHNGLRSIRAHMGTGDYWRLRLGIAQQDADRGRDFVLSRPKPEHGQRIRDASQRACTLVASSAGLSWDELMQRLHSSD